MKKALILHAWYNKPQDNWYPWLKTELEKKQYQALLPELPTMDTDLPDMELQLKEIDKLVDENTVIIGHSLSCLLAMRLAETKQYAKMILVAGWDFDDLTKEHKLFWPGPIDHESIKQHVKDIYCISSDNDPYTTAFTVEEMSKRLGGKFILIKSAGHFVTKDGITKIPQVLNLL